MAIIGINDDVIRLNELANVSRIFWGTVKEVDAEAQTMRVEVHLASNTRNLYTVQINNMFCAEGAGIRIMPVRNATRVLLFRDFDNSWIHVGYVLENIKNITADRAGTKEASTTVLLQRYLEEGETQILGITNNEILLSNDGSVLIKSQNGAFLRLENYTATLEGHFSSTRILSGNVQIRSGNVQRPVSNVGTDEAVYVVDDEVKIESDIEDVNASKLPLSEFTVQVGVSLSDPNTPPTVGTLSLGHRMIDNEGNEVAMSGNGVQFKVELANGGGIGIDENGSFYILDRFGGDGTVFNSGADGEGAKAFRVGGNFISVSAETGIELMTESGAMITLSKEGYISIKNKDGRSIELNQKGAMLSLPEAEVTIQAKELKFAANTVHFGMMPTDNLLAARLFAAMYDVHTHAGPCGPVVIPITPLVNAGAVTVAGINVSI